MASSPKARLWLWQCSKCNYKNGCRWWKKLHCFQVYRSSSCFSVSNRFPPPSKPLIPSVSPQSLSFPQHTAVICTGKLSGFSSSGSELPQTSSAEAVVIGTLWYYSQGQICALIISGNSKSHKESVTQAQIYFLSALLPKIRPQYTHKPRLQLPKTEPKHWVWILMMILTATPYCIKNPWAQKLMLHSKSFPNSSVPGRWCVIKTSEKGRAQQRAGHVNCQLKLISLWIYWQVQDIIHWDLVMLGFIALRCQIMYHGISRVGLHFLFSVGLCVKVQFLPNKCPKFHGRNYFAIIYFSPK